jgi:hypothetical protein
MDETENGAMVVVFGSANAFGRDVNETELMLLTGTVFVVSVLIVLVYKLARGWDDYNKMDGNSSLLPMHHSRRVTSKWIKTRQQHYGQLGTIMEHEEVSHGISIKRM